MLRVLILLYIEDKLKGETRRILMSWGDLVVVWLEEVSPSLPFQF